MNELYNDLVVFIGTVTVTFAKAESDKMDPAPMYSMSLNDQEVDLGGMGGLSVTSEINDNDINTVEVIILVSLGGGYTMPFTGELTQVSVSE